MPDKSSQSGHIGGGIAAHAPYQRNRETAFHRIGN